MSAPDCPVPEDVIKVNDRALRRERPEPDEAPNPLHPFALLVFVGMTVWGAGYFALYSGDDFEPRGGDLRSAVAPPSDTVDGKAVFSNVCASCHQATGLGVPGAFPPLAGSSWVVGDEETVVRILLRGITGPIEVKGSTYNSVMPAFGNLKDDELAALATYVRTGFGNSASAVDVATVKKVRDAQAGQSAPWAGGAALEAARSR
jgi:mono/diheme cytochrome c family protein